MVSQRQLFLQYQAQTSSAPLLLEIEKAEGVYMFDPNGKKYLDLISGIGVSTLGHRHPKVVNAIKEQVDKYLHLMVYGELVQTPQVKLAQKLTTVLPSPLSVTYFVNSGSEAIEGAMKLAKRYTGRTEIVSFYNAYHGSSQGALSINGSEDFKQAYRPLLPDIRQLHFNSIPELEQISERTAAVIIEPIQGEGGVRIPDSSYMQALRKRCTETGALLVCDEIQTGFGRTGKFWGFENFGIVPDVIACAKGMGGGMPIGAFISSPAIMSVLSHDPVLGHITTFGGHPVSCAASLACLQVILEDKLVQQVVEKEKLFLKELKHPRIKSIRSKGLLMAVELESFEIVQKTIQNCLNAGLLTDWFLHCNNSLRIAPPLIITKEQIKEACSIIRKSLDF